MRIGVKFYLRFLDPVPGVSVVSGSLAPWGSALCLVLPRPFPADRLLALLCLGHWSPRSQRLIRLLINISVYFSLFAFFANKSSLVGNAELLFLFVFSPNNVNNISNDYFICFLFMFTWFNRFTPSFCDFTVALYLSLSLSFGFFSPFRWVIPLKSWVSVKIFRCHFVHLNRQVSCSLFL